MDPKIKDELEKLARALLTDPEVNGGHQALDMLGELEKVAHHSIFGANAPVATKKAAPTTASHSNRFGIDPQLLIQAARAQMQAQQAQMSAPTPASAKSAPAKPAAPQVTTTREEYQAALRDEKLIEALLEYQRTAVREQEQAKQPSGFAPVEIPEVEAKPKPRPNFHKSTGVALPILRGK